MKSKFLAILLLTVQLCFGQNVKLNNDIIELSRIYRYYGTKDYSELIADKKIATISSPELARSKKFIAEVVKVKTKIGAKEYLVKPDSSTLKYLYAARGVNYNLFEKYPKDSAYILDSLLKENTSCQELLAGYYSMIFSRLTNKSDGFDMSDFDFKMGEYNLKDDTEKSIFFLEAMERLNSQIWGYMNIPQPPNYKSASEVIKKYPRFNGELYYLFTDLDLQDFLITIDKRRPKESFKNYYLNSYINTLLYHLVCLSQNNQNDDQKQDVLNRSIIKKENYWRFYKEPELLKSIFKGN